MGKQESLPLSLQSPQKSQIFPYSGHQCQLGSVVTSNAVISTSAPSVVIIAPFWQRRYYDFNVHSAEKTTENRNPVMRELVEKPEDWPWSGYRHYATGLRGTVEIESFWTAWRHAAEQSVSIIKIGRRGMRGDTLSGVIRLIRRTLFFSIILTVGAASSRAALGQSVVVRLVNGRNGKPIAKVRVYIGFDDLKGKPLDLKTNTKGEIQFEAHGAKTFQVRPVGVVACGEQPIGAPYPNFSIDEILKEGMLTKNDCGQLNEEPLRGRLQYFVRPATGWQLFKN